MLDYFNNISFMESVLIVAGLIPLFILLFTTVINIIFGPFLRKSYPISDTPKVSVMVPARNEEDNIENCIRSIMNQNYRNFELIVLDDNSTDRTYEILRQLQKEFSNLKVIKGLELPNGWLGKNYACKQLSDNATGAIFVFTDADNTHSPNALTNTVAYMQRFELDLLSAFPQQKTLTFFEKLIVPIIDLIIYSGLPLWTTLFVPYRAFAAANGQWIAFNSKTYNAVGGHEAVKSQIVEDVEFAKLFKTKSYRTLTTIGTDVVFCRMYKSLPEIRQGLSKNLFGLTGYNPTLFLIILLIAIISMVLPFVLFFL